MPDYYKNFSCKIGGCRSACCEGWRISVSMNNYFHLVGLNCKKELRSRLDVGLRVLDRPSVDEYACFEPRYDGNCPMRLADGRCALHAELGEDVLPDVCRLYPRGIHRGENGLECSMADSCEGVLELFFEREAPIKFSLEQMAVKLPEISAPSALFDTMGHERDLRLRLISLMQDRTRSLPERIISVGGALRTLERALEWHDENLIVSIISEDPPETETTAFGIGELSLGLTVAKRMVDILDGRSESIRDFGKEALDCFGDGDDAKMRYFEAKRSFESAFPRWELFFEHMLVNHIFFSRFPFQDRPESVGSEYLGLCGVYSVLRFLALGGMSGGMTKDSLIDRMAAAFRLIDHTEYDRYAAHILQSLGCDSDEKLRGLLWL